jgi:AsmA protein
MKKWLKIIVSVVTVTLLVAVCAIGLLITFVNPNQLKPFVSNEIKKYTGMTVNIGGDLAWSFYPYLGVKVGHIEFNNPPGFQQKLLAELNSLTVSVRLLPLLHARIESDGMTLNGLKINLIKNAAGQLNWQSLSVPQTSIPQQNSSAEPSTQAVKNIVGLAISGVDITNASIQWIDEQKNQRVLIDQLNVDAKNIGASRPFPIKIRFHFAKTNPVLSGEIQIESKVSLQWDKQYYRFMSTQLSGKIHRNNQNLNINTQMNVLIDRGLQRIECQNLRGTMADVNWTGKLEIKKFETQPIVTGHVKTETFTLQNLLSKLDVSPADAPKAKNMYADFNFTFDTAKNAASTLQNLTLYGLIKSDDLQLQKIKATDLVVQVKLEAGFLKLTSISALFYQGNLQSDATINLNPAIAQLAVNAKLTNIHTESLLADLKSDRALTVSGVGDVELQLTSTGLDGRTLLNNLNGASQFKLNEGILKGIDVSYWVANAQAIAKQKTFTGTDTHQTPFGVLTGTAAIQNGVISNHDLFLDSPRYDTRGKGTIDLNKQQIDFLLEIAAKGAADDRKNLANLYKLTIPIRIVGQLNQPHISVDVGEIAKQVAKQQIDKVKEDVGNKIQKQIDEKLPEVGNKLLKSVLGN